MTETIRTRYGVRVGGSGERTLVLAHGLATNQGSWAALVERLAPDFRIVTFDYPGAGTSDPRAFDRARHGSLAGYTDDLRAVLEAFGGDAPIVVGHSISGAIAILDATHDGSRISAIVALGASPRYLNDPPAYEGGFSQRDVAELLGLMESNFIGWSTSFAKAVAAPGLETSLASIFQSSDPAAVRAFAEATLTCDIRAALPHVAVPTLVVQCTNDVVVPVHVGRWMAAQLPHGTYRELDVAGHFPHLSDPALVESTVRDFVGAS
jgi:sigma-B regulation protein RsbQ